MPCAASESVQESDAMKKTRLEVMREERKLKRSSLATITGISARSILNYEKRLRCGSMAVREALARSLNTEASYLFAKTGVAL